MCKDNIDGLEFTLQLMGHVSLVMGGKCMVNHSGGVVILTFTYAFTCMTASLCVDWRLCCIFLPLIVNFSYDCQSWIKVSAD